VPRAWDCAGSHWLPAAKLRGGAARAGALYVEADLTEAQKQILKIIWLERVAVHRGLVSLIVSVLQVAITTILLPQSPQQLCRTLLHTKVMQKPWPCSSWKRCGSLQLLYSGFPVTRNVSRLACDLESVQRIPQHPCLVATLPEQLVHAAGISAAF